MSAFVSWIMSILAIVIIATILDIFLAEKKLGKLIRSIIASLIVLMIISPLPTFFGGLKSCSFEGGTVELDSNFLEQMNRKKVERLERGVEESFADKGYKNIKVEITAVIDIEIKITLVRVFLADLVLDSTIKNINKIERVREMTAEFLLIDKNKVLIFE